MSQITLEKLETPQVRPYKYKIEQTAKGARITVHGDDLSDIVDDYVILQNELTGRGFKIAPEE